MSGKYTFMVIKENLMVMHDNYKNTLWLYVDYKVLTLMLTKKSVVINGRKFGDKLNSASLKVSCIY